MYESVLLHMCWNVGYLVGVRYKDNYTKNKENYMI